MAQSDREFFYVKLSCPNNSDDGYKFGNIVENLIYQRVFDETLTNIPWHLDDANPGDLLFLHIGGDVSKKSKYFDKERLQNYKNGIYGIGVIKSIQPDEKSLKCTFYGIYKSITKKNLYYLPQFIDSLGASTKGIPNQAGLYKIDTNEAKSFIEYLKITDNSGIASKILNNIVSKDFLYKLAKKQLTKDDEIFPPVTSQLIHQLSDDILQNNKPKVEEHTQFNLKHLIASLDRSGLTYKVKLIHRFIASLLTKPFVILTGLSGSGKTKLAQAFVQWICQDKSQYRMVPVGSD